MATANTIVASAFQELQVSLPADLAPEDATFGLEKLNRLFDLWNADGRAVYGSQMSTFTLTPSLNPHTIGLTANAPTLAVTVNRPERIDQANIVVGTGTSAQRYGLSLRDRTWWMHQSLPNQTTTIPSDLYYEPGWPNGSIYLAPVPSTAYGLELLWRVALAQLTGAATFTLPPGYQDAIILTLAENLATAYDVPAQDLSLLSHKAREARTLVFGANASVPRIRTIDAGMPNSGPGGWDYKSGSFSGGGA